MSKRRKAFDVVYKMPYAGFVRGGYFVEIQPEDEDDFMPCMLDCGDEDCREWIDCLILTGDTLEDAVQSSSNKQYTGTAYHVSECQMANDRP